MWSFGRAGRRRHPPADAESSKLSTIAILESALFNIRDCERDGTLPGIRRRGPVAGRPRPSRPAAAPSRVGARHAAQLHAHQHGERDPEAHHPHAARPQDRLQERLRGRGVPDPGRLRAHEPRHLLCPGDGDTGDPAGALEHVARGGGRVGRGDRRHGRASRAPRHRRGRLGRGQGPVRAPGGEPPPTRAQPPRRGHLPGDLQAHL